MPVEMVQSVLGKMEKRMRANGEDDTSYATF
jgi:hypothetical protein